MIKKFLSMLLATVMLMSLVTIVTAEEALSGKLTIWAWGADAEAEQREAIIQAFIKAHPELEVEYSIIPTADSVWDQKATAALTSGSGPDLIQMSPDYFGMNTKYYLDLRPYVERDGIDLDAVLVPGMINGYYDTDGKLEGFPMHANIFMMAINKDMFDEAGVAYPEQGWTLDNMLDWGKAFVGGEGAGKTYAMAKHWVMNAAMPYAGGSAPYSDDLSECYMNTPEIEKSLELYQKLILEGYMPNDAESRTIPSAILFQSGLCAMYPLGGFEAAQFLADSKENGINVGLVPMPMGIGNDGKEINVIYATGWAITTTAKNPDAAWAFMKENAFANEEMGKATAIAGMPAGKDVAENYYAKIEYEGFGTTFNDYMVQHLDLSHINPWGGTLASTGDIWANMVEAVTMDGKSPAEAMATYSQQAMDEFASYGFSTAIKAN
ncbi:MAG: sugar ABC transporter substrate-binding protein [Clostridiales bacterium]|nr:sugar ABC transporter substrate-binding protein [Clostridiales bacterium]